MTALGAPAPPAPPPPPPAPELVHFVLLEGGALCCRAAAPPALDVLARPVRPEDGAKKCRVSLRRHAPVHTTAPRLWPHRKESMRWETKWVMACVASSTRAPRCSAMPASPASCSPGRCHRSARCRTSTAASLLFETQEHGAETRIASLAGSCRDGCASCLLSGR